MTEDTHLVLQALAKTDSSTIHDVNGVVALYRSSLATHPEVAALYESGLRAFVQAGKLTGECRRKRYIDPSRKPLKF